MNFIKVTFIHKNDDGHSFGIKKVDKLDCVIQKDDYTVLMDEDGTSCNVKEKGDDIANTLVSMGFNVQSVVKKTDYN